MTNMVPAIRMMVDTMLNMKLDQPTAMALRGIIPVMYAGPWIARIAMVR